jgi:hypothetical protein
VHLNSLGHPVVGDSVYGPRRTAGTLEVSPATGFGYPVRCCMPDIWVSFIRPVAKKSYSRHPFLRTWPKLSLH